MKDFRIKVVKIIDFRIDRLKSSKDFLNMLFLVFDLTVLVDLVVLVDLIDDEINDDKIDDDELVNSLSETKRSNRIL